MSVISGHGAADPPLTGGEGSPPGYEQQSASAYPCPPPLAVALIGLGLAALVIALGAGGLGGALRIAGGVVAALVAVLGAGLVVVAPNESRVLILFGRYAGTLSEARLWWVNPFTILGRK